MSVGTDLRNCCVVGLVTVLAATLTVEAGDRALSFEDLMKFRQIRDASISDDGAWVAYTLVPDRGDGEAVARSTTSDREFRIERGSDPVVSADGLWMAAFIAPSLEDREAAGAKGKKKDSTEDDKPKTGLSILDLRAGTEKRIEEVEAFAFSDDGRWLAFRHHAEKKDASESGEKPTEDTEEKKQPRLGTTLKLRDLTTGSETTIEHVSEFAWAENAPILAFAISAPEGEGNRAAVLRLGRGMGLELALHEAEDGLFENLGWAREATHFAFTAAVLDDDGEPGDAEIWVWLGEGEAKRVASRGDAPDSWTIPSTNELSWSDDGGRLFFGFKPIAEEAAGSEEDGEEDEEGPFDPYDFESLLEDREVDVWHWNDPRIIPNQKERWEKSEKDRVYRAVVHLGSGRVVALADLELPRVMPIGNPHFALGWSDVPYLKQLTWDGAYSDLYAVDLENGRKQRIAEKLPTGGSGGGSISPDGRFVLFYDDRDWHLYETATKTLRNMTAQLEVSFANEDHDYPREPPGYGHTKWMADSTAVFVYDKFDIWRLPTDGGRAMCLTRGDGRRQHTVFRVIDLDPKSRSLAPGSQLLLEAYHDHEKHDAFYSISADGGEMSRLYGTGGHRLEFVAKAENADRFLFTRESYVEYPDLWISNTALEEPRKLSLANPQIEDFAWGSAELVEWETAAGVPLQGVLIKPGNYQPGERYPVVIYFYRLFSERLHLFNQPVVNHRPSFPVYASNGYAVFLPDIRFEIGRPGPSAVECLLSGVQKLIDMGVADADAIGLHGHSWSGYQTAFVITQTDIFAAAVAGAPVSNMTSAYSGIRWGTGLARQFQYEKTQSRIGGSLWEAPELYIANSPVFFADRINTPLLIQFGDEDGAVPWYQGIELYLACRRLQKNCIMLQYRGEPHHLKKYPNKLDYSIKMKEFFDHWLKGEPAPAWMTEGVPYSGK